MVHKYSTYPKIYIMQSTMMTWGEGVQNWPFGSKIKNEDGGENENCINSGVKGLKVTPFWIINLKKNHTRPPPCRICAPGEQII